MAIESMEIDEIEDIHQQQEDRDYVLNGGEINASKDVNSSSVSIKNMTQGRNELTRKCAISRLDAKNSTSTESYKLDEDFEPVRHKPSEESNIEQIPVEIAAKSNNSNSYNKQESTSVIIDTNSILSRREPVPMNHFSGSGSSGNSADSNKSGIFSMALSTQELYPSDMRATITPIPQTSSSTPAKLTPSTSTIASPSPSTSQTYTAGLPESIDDMILVEAASLVVPYLYQKPLVTELKTFVKDATDQITKRAKEQQKKEKEQNNGGDDNDAMEPEKSNSYFETTLGKFFMDIGLNQVQEYVQSDLLKKQKRQRDREGQNANTIQSLMKDLEYSKEKNKHFKSPLKKCEYCNFKTESLVVMANHLETPHIKNQMYKCNFCPYKVLSPHDILSHMEAKHGVKGRLEKAPALHPCPICPYETKKKSDVARHLVSCERKFKPKKNLAPPVDWEPPAKTPRVPMRRDRGRPRTKASPTIKGNTMMRRSSNMVTNQAMPGGSVLIPTNNQLNENQVYQQQSQKNEMHQPSISIISPPSATPSANVKSNKLGDMNFKNFVATCEICDDIIRGFEQLCNHMQSVHMVKLLLSERFKKCRKCSFQFFTQQGLERHLLGLHGLVSRSMQEAANKNEDTGRCLLCGVDQMELLNHLERDHSMVLTPARSSYKCRVCAARFAMQTEFEKHVYCTHSVAVELAMNKKVSPAAKSTGDSLMKPLKIKNCPLPRPSATPSANMTSNKPGDTNLNNVFSTCEICDMNITDLEQLYDHMKRVHMAKLLPDRVYNCKKCSFLFLTHQGLERHLLGHHGRVSRSMQEAANKNEDAGKCLLCGVNQMRLLNHLERDHGMVLTPARLSYKCRVCAARFAMHKECEKHVYLTHSRAAKLAMDIKVPPAAKSAGDSLMKLMINDEITIIPLPAKASTSKEGSPATSSDSAGTSAIV